ncbi:MAG: hypothetical protein IPL61_05135 [Myxococcales bacterium]|nr:hypothetical protein [Myxococcales bacterium]
MRIHAALVLLAVTAVVPAAAAAPVIERVVVVGRADPAGPWTDAATEARADAGAELAVVAIARDGRARVVLADPAIAPLRLGGRAVPTSGRADLATLGAIAVRWSIVEPHGFRTGAAANGATSRFYSNVSTERADFGRWLGYDRIEYFATEVRPWTDGVAAARIPAEIGSGDPRAIQIAGVGTVRYQAALRLPSGAVVASPGAEAVDAFGLLPSVHRVSLRQSDDFVGWLSAYLLVPEVFGSAGGGKNHQTERFTGADCADVMVGARRRGGARLAYTNVAGLPKVARTIAGATTLDDDGRPARPITGVARGDLIRIDYGGALTGHTPRGWDHVAALWEDRSDPDGPAHGGPDGQLDGFDLVIHMGHPRLVIEPLAEQAPATVDVLRWK